MPIEPGKIITDSASKLVSGDLGNIQKEEDKIFDAAYKVGGFAKTLLSSFQEIDDVIVSLDKKFASVARTMGVGSTYAGLIKENFAKAAPEVFKMGLGLEDIEKAQQGVLEATQKNVVLTDESIKSLLSTQKVVGVNANTLSKSFLDAGMEVSHITEYMYKVVQTSQKLGVNAQVVSSMVVSNLDKLNKYSFDGGVDGLAKMAAKAAMFRIDMSETFQLADKLLSPENAIEVASALQRLGGSTSQLASPLRLMDLAQNNVPELQNQLGKLVEKYTFFDEKTKSFQIMPGARRELKAVGDALGVSYDSLTKMSIEGAKLKKKMSEISFTGLDFTKEQQEQIANLSQLNKSGKYEISFKDKSGETITKSIDELNSLTSEQQNNFKDFLQKQSSEVGQTEEQRMISLATEQLGVAEQIVAKIEAFKNAIPVTVAGTQGGEVYLKNSLDIITSKFDGVTNNFNLGNEKVVKGLNENAQTLNGIIKDVGNVNITGAFDKLGNLTGDVSKIIVDEIVSPALKDLKDTGAGKILDGIGVDVTKITSLLENLVNGAGQAKDFIWRPGQGISKFSENDLVIGGTGLISQNTKTNVNTSIVNSPKNDNVNKTESTVGGEITFKVVVDSSSSKNISITEANLIGERVAAAIKSRPDLQDEFKKALNFSMNEPKPR